MKKLYISKTEKKIFGVCGGIGETYDIDPTLVRLVMVFLCFATAILPVALTYLAAWIIVPEKPAE
ncbi:MAG: PspC domain-containing protein [Planctomycetes bacterium]|nr:PspC domain-containing protein [Planctomycetota bacterium]